MVALREATLSSVDRVMKVYWLICCVTVKFFLSTRKNWV